MFFKKFSLLLLSIILIFGAFLPQGRSMASGGSITIATDTVNVRGGPGLSYPLVKQAKRGESYSIVKEKDDWIEIQLSFGRTGWVVNWLVTKDNGKTASASTGPQEEKTVAIANTDQLRVRSGPGTSFQIVGFLTNGQAVTILDQNENWYKISTSFGDGWVAREFIEMKTVMEETKQKAPTSKNSSKTGMVNGDTLNVRSEPTTSSSVVGKLAGGTSVTILSEKDHWLEVSFATLTGWVSSEFIDTDAGSSKESPKKETTGLIGTVTASSLSVRSGSSLDSKIIGAVAKGKSFAIIEENNNWAKIEFTSGSFGWVAGWYLNKTTSKNQISQVKESSITILHNGTNIRKGPNVQTDVLARANEGDIFSVKSLANDWYEIKLKSGKTGYVAGWIVSINGSEPQIEKSGVESYLRNKTIVLDPGHGGGDNGATGANGTLEKELTLRTARLLYDKLRAAGAQVYLTRSNDTYLPLPSRVSVAHSYDADAFISIHYDSNEDRSVRGSTGYYYHSYQKDLAETVFAATVGQTKLNNRGVQFGDFHVIRENRQKAMLIELGYISNPEEEITLKSGLFQENAASGLYNGLARFFKEN